MFQSKATARQHFLGTRGQRPHAEGLLTCAKQVLPDVHRIALYVSRGPEPQTGALIEMQRSLDSIAVEVERVSENQRYVTKLVGEKDKLPR